MKTIEIDDEVYDYLLRKIESFGEKANDVLRRLLKLDIKEKSEDDSNDNMLCPIVEKKPEKLMDILKPKHELKGINKKKKIRASIRQDKFTMPILESLIELGNSASANEVLYLVEKKMKHKFTDIDLAMLESGREIRWKNKARWQRNKMKEEGLLKNNSAPGIWEITESGIEYYKRNKIKADNNE